MPSNPAKTGQFEVDEVDDGYLVYDRAGERVHYLNHTAALVLELCTGDNDEAEIARIMQTAYDLPRPPAEEIGQCLGRLRSEGLIG